MGIYVSFSGFEAAFFPKRLSDIVTCKHVVRSCEKQVEHFHTFWGEMVGLSIDDNLVIAEIKFYFAERA